MVENVENVEKQDRNEQGSELEALAQSFLAHRPRLHAIAQRALGSPWSADDAVQETWIRLQRADAAAIEDLQPWLTTVVSRVCIDLIRRSERRPEVPAEELPPEPGGPGDLAEDVLRTEELALAMHVVLDSLGPLERLAVILHDVFALPYSQIAPILDRTPTAARQLASRARARLSEVDAAAVRQQQEGVIEAFLAAAREGDFGGLLQLLDPEIELRSDAAAVEAAAAALADGAPPLAPMMEGSDAVARVFSGRMHDVARIDLGGLPAAAYIREREMQAVYLIHSRRGLITRIEVLADPEHLAALPRGDGQRPGGRAQDA
ncbi:MAG: sigma-70 family RNA polymerase sigma factor [Dermabacteraceae bacterium]